VKSIPAHGGGITSLSWASAASPVVLATGACESQRSCWLLDPSRLWKKNISLKYLVDLHSLKYRWYVLIYWILLTYCNQIQFQAAQHEEIPIATSKCRVAGPAVSKAGSRWLGGVREPELCGLLPLSQAYWVTHLDQDILRCDKRSYTFNTCFGVARGQQFWFFTYSFNMFQSTHSLWLLQVVYDL